MIDNKPKLEKLYLLFSSQENIHNSDFQEMLCRVVPDLSEKYDKN